MKQKVTAIVLNNEVALQAARLVGNEARLCASTKVYIIEDKIVPANSPEVSEAQQEMAAFARCHGLEYIYGQAMAPYYLTEKLKAGDLVLSGDPDLLMVGAVGAMGLVADAEQLAEAFRTGVVELPELHRFVVELQGELPENLDVRDAAAFLEQQLQDKVDKETVIVFRQQGNSPAIAIGTEAIGTDEAAIARAAKRHLSLDACRLLCGWCQKLGVKSAYFASEETNGQPSKNGPENIDYVLELNHLPQRRYNGSKVNAVFIGGAYGGTLEAIKQTADILAKAFEKGQKVAYGLRLNVAPASAEIYAEAADRGYLTTIMEAQGMVLNQCALPPVQARIGAGEVLVSNDIHAETGYAGDAGIIYLANTRVAVEAALTGYIGGEA